MKTKKTLWISAAFFTGTLFGMGMLALVSFTSPSGSASPDPVLTKVPVEDAKALFQNYYLSASPVTLKLKGFVIEKSEFTAMSYILAAEPKLSGFRIYFGADRYGNRRAIILGVDSEGADLTNTIYSATSTRVGPCPPICDFNSPVGGQ